MSAKLDDMTIKQLRKHARDVAKALARKEAARAGKLRKKVAKYTQEMGENIGDFFSKKMPGNDTPPPAETTPAVTTPAKAKSEKPPKYVEPDGTPRQRLGKWSEKYTKKQIDGMKQT